VSTASARARFRARSDSRDPGASLAMLEDYIKDPEIPLRNFLKFILDTDEVPA
jgi:hypothetical protein